MTDTELNAKIDEFVETFRPKAIYLYKLRLEMRVALKLLVGEAQLFGRAERSKSEGETTR